MNAIKKTCKVVQLFDWMIYPEIDKVEIYDDSMQLITTTTPADIRENWPDLRMKAFNLYTTINDVKILEIIQK